MLNISQCKKYLGTKGLRASRKACVKLQEVADKLLTKIGELASIKAEKANRKTVMDEDILSDIDIDYDKSEVESKETEE